MANERVTITIVEVSDFIKLHAGSPEPIFVNKGLHGSDYLWYIASFESGVPIIMGCTVQAKLWRELSALGDVIEGSVDID